MALLEIKKDPSKAELNWFGLLILVFSCLLSGILYWKFESVLTVQIVIGIGAGLCLIYYAVPPLRKPIYLGWLYAAFPIGWTISHTVLLLTYYLLMTPIGLLMRIVGRDTMRRKLDPNASTYWLERKPVASAKSYFRQY